MQKLIEVRSGFGRSLCCLNNESDAVNGANSAKIGNERCKKWMLLLHKEAGESMLDTRKQAEFLPLRSTTCRYTRLCLASLLYILYNSHG